jgi:hypothetical protein
LRPADNFFSVSRLHSLQYRFQAGDNIESLLNRFEQNDWRGAIVGAKGNGKTSLMLELEGHLEDSGINVHKLFLNEEKRRFTRQEYHSLCNDLSDNDIILLDGAEQMSALAWWRFRQKTKNARGLIITIHSPGKLPTIISCKTDLKQFIEMVHELSANSLKPIYPDEALDRIFRSHQGNVRQAFRQLYDESAYL